MGCDLCTVFCAEEASIPIKIFSPELMVSSFYSKSETDNEEEYSGENCDENIRKVCAESSIKQSNHVRSSLLFFCPIGNQLSPIIITSSTDQLKNNIYIFRLKHQDIAYCLLLIKSHVVRLIVCTIMLDTYITTQQHVRTTFLFYFSYDDL